MNEHEFYIAMKKRFENAPSYLSQSTDYARGYKQAWMSAWKEVNQEINKVKPDEKGNTLPIDMVRTKEDVIEEWGRMKALAKKADCRHIPAEVVNALSDIAMKLQNLDQLIEELLNG